MKRHMMIMHNKNGYRETPISYTNASKNYCSVSLVSTHRKIGHDN
jgi:hypothetical protein